MNQASVKILAVDDNAEALFALETLLKTQGYEVITADNGKAAWESIQSDRPDLVLLDVSMPELDGHEVTRRTKSDPQLRFITIILLTANTSLEDIVHGLEQGADGYINKPYKAEELLARVSAAVRLRRLYQELQQTIVEREQLREHVQQKTSFGNIIGKSSSMQQVFKLVERVKDADVPVLIAGESGTGKELIASAIHFHGARRNKQFVAQNCGALNDNLLESELFGHVRGAFTGAVRDKQGLFETAHGGTLFLDEVGEMSPALQVKLLRVLQEGTFIPLGGTTQKKVDVRVLAASHRNIVEMVERGQFREDLYYRLNVVTIQLPPLRERKEDIPLLVEHFLQQKAVKTKEAKKEISKEALQALSDFRWPGNIRQLQNEIERACLMSESDSIEKDILSPEVRDGDRFADKGENAGSDAKLKDAVASVERRLIAKTLADVKGNKSEAARVLGISRSNLIAKVQEYELE